MNVILFDDLRTRTDLLPFTFTRPVASVRIGILTIREKWEKYFSQPASFLTQDYLKTKFPLASGSDNLLINGAVCPDQGLFEAVNKLRMGESLMTAGSLIAARSNEADPMHFSSLKPITYNGSVCLIDQPWKIFQFNGDEIRADFALLTKGRKSAGITDPYTRTYSPEQIFVEDGAQITAAVINASTGPVYIGKNAQVQEGSVIRGPFSLGEESIVNMGAKMRGDITIGPHCKVGGEVSNAVLFGYSNKAHDGFLGSSVLGEWCNLGADTNTSNLKNNYEAVKLWNYGTKRFQSTGLTFCGLMMGDHSKCGINTMFNTGTVVGVGANIFGDGYPRNFVPSFAWGGAAGFTTFQLEKMLETAEKAMARRQVTLVETDKEILGRVFTDTATERIWEGRS